MISWDAKEKVQLMKKILRIGFIGALHMTVYLWLLPFVILPKFGNIGTKITVTILILISLIVLSSLIIKKRK
jgi:predicted membrane-bound spermidine synthase